MNCPSKSPRLRTLSQRHLSFEETPEPAMTRARLNAVSFKEDKAPLIHDASVTFTIGHPAKAAVSDSPLWQQVSLAKPPCPPSMPCIAFVGHAAMIYCYRPAHKWE